MTCSHLVVFRAANDRHQCRDCGAHLIVTRHGPGPAYRTAAVQRLVEASTAFVEITRDRNSALYVAAFADLAAAARAIERADDAARPPASPARRMRRRVARRS